MTPLIIEVWNGNTWRLAATLEPGMERTMNDWRSRLDNEPVRVVVKDDRTTITTADEVLLVELRDDDEPWERLMNATWMAAPTLCRLHYREIRSPDAPK